MLPEDPSVTVIARYPRPLTIHFSKYAKYRMERILELRSSGWAA
jgi:hypothetical protein